MAVKTGYEPGTPSWVDISTPDVDAGVAFYGTLFGWDATDADEESGGYRMFSQDGHNVAGIGPTRSPEEPSAWMTYVTVESADETAAAVEAAGGSTVAPPMDVMTAGRMAVFTDDSGAYFAVWEPNEHIGCELVNEPNSLTWNEVRTRDTEAAKRFYKAVFGWETMAFEGMAGYSIWGPRPGFGPDEGRGGLFDMDVGGMPAEVPPHWGVAFAVEDADATVARATELGATVAMPPMDSEIGRMAGLIDPAGASFVVIALATPPEDPAA